MSENESEKRQPTVEIHQSVEIEITQEHKRIKRHRQPNRDYQDTDKPIKSRNYGRKRAIRKRNYWKRG